MAKEEMEVVYEGKYFKILWRQRCQAIEYFESLPFTDQAKALALFARMADVGKIYDKTKFRQETEKLYVFKPQSHRFFCFFTKGRRIIIVSAYHKQSERAPKSEILRAEALRKECIEHL